MALKCGTYASLLGRDVYPASRVAYRFRRSLGVSLSGEAGSADLGGSSKYSSENLED